MVGTARNPAVPTVISSVTREQHYGSLESASGSTRRNAPMIFVLVLLVLMLAVFGLWLASLLEVIRTPSGYASGSQLVWLLVLLLAGPIGLIVYRLTGRPRTPAI
jgi:hypothetical protein